MRRDTALAEATPAAERASRWWLVAALVAAVGPMLYAGVVAVARHWVPIGDNALFAIRARDVFTRHPPLLGTWTSASLTTKIDFNNPGPLQFDAFAIPTTIFGSGGVGLAIAVALVNALAAGAVVMLAFRRGGALLASVAAAIVAILAWTLGSAVLIDAVQPNSLLLPFLALLCCAWAISDGDLPVLPFAVALASMIVQAYVTYVYLVGALSIWIAIALVRRVRRLQGGDQWPELRARLRRIGIVSAVVALVCWIQPLVQQFFSDGPGNITQMLRNLRQAPQPVGVHDGTRAVAQILAVAPMWFRPALREYFELGPAQNVTFRVAVPALAVLTAVLVLLTRAAYTRGAHTSGRALVTALVALVGGLVTAWRIPLGALGITAHVFLWLFPLAAFIWFAVAGFLASRLTRVRPAVVSGFFIAAAIVFGALNLPTSDQGASSPARAIPVARDLANQVRRAHIHGPVLVDMFHSRFGDQYTTALFAQLQADGVRFVSDDRGLLFQVGFARRLRPGAARVRLVLREGDDAAQPEPNGQLIARHDGLTTAERSELQTLKETLRDYITAQGVHYNHRGLTAEFRLLAPPIDDPLAHDADQIFAARTIVPLVEHRYVTFPKPWAQRFARYAWLQRRADDDTVAVYLVPLNGSA
ncbi:MAG TPA: hypothetical protein VFR41_13070 [Acidimicrobiia bacterium]|nr:hypothetical protein [Acidimicrobiia bacterium]